MRAYITDSYACMFWLNQLVKTALLVTIQYGTGKLVLSRGVRVNYTRKINHFALFFIPMFLDSLFEATITITTVLVSAVLSVGILALYVRPIRSRVPVVRTMFASFDRPEDRPHTLSWLSTQVALGWMVAIGMVIWMAQIGIEKELQLVPILVNGIGDGLAEPVGVRFGKHKYRAYALFSKKKYVRSLEGSACVFITSLVVLGFYHSSFTPMQFWIGMGLFPIIMTATEAFSPHTWDTPFIFGVGYLTLIGLSCI